MPIKTRISALVFGCCLSVSPAFGVSLYPTDDGFVDYNPTPSIGTGYSILNWFPTVVTGSYAATGSWQRGFVLFDISSLWGYNLAAGSATYDFYSFGFSGAGLYFVNSDSASISGMSSWLPGPFIAGLDSSIGWKSYDVTALLRTSITSHAPYFGFVFNTIVGFGSGSLAATEDTQGRGSFLNVADTAPEPASLLMSSGGILMVAWLIWRTRRLRV